MSAAGPRTFVLVSVAAATLSLSAASTRTASVTTTPDTVFGVRVTLTDDAVTFAPKPLRPKVGTAFYVTVVNKARRRRWFRFAEIKTPSLAPGRRMSFLWSFVVPGYVRWDSGGSGVRHIRGTLRVRRAPIQQAPLPFN